jgi:hypothetical protein
MFVVQELIDQLTLPALFYISTSCHMLFLDAYAPFI